MNYFNLHNLALSDTGFLFDPSTGRTYTLNETAVFIVNLLKQEKAKEKVLDALLEEYEVTREQVERDFLDLVIQLKEMGLIRE
ncbi:MAG: HPr-rel-A system PqqD family peptide chaperone [Spirochaetota bacterium]